ncbi:hypothetical protein E2C01_014091 [Portunus trituberculatus]|uniref:Uncharacterized protein n=1 Tax=Portunus trituberculatus TaxID=210409 RepID=A0A5B7DJ09_PORTR|nr:hypothetical protein [Portunus trituberculatus]
MQIKSSNHTQNSRFHIHSAYYMVTLYSFRNLCGGLK